MPGETTVLPPSVTVVDAGLSGSKDSREDLTWRQSLGARTRDGMMTRVGVAERLANDPSDVIDAVLLSRVNPAQPPPRIELPSDELPWMSRLLKPAMPPAAAAPWPLTLGARWAFLNQSGTLSFCSERWILSSCSDI